MTRECFAGEPLNDTDRILQSLGANSERLIVSLLPPTRDLETDSFLVMWDIVLDKG